MAAEIATEAPPRAGRRPGGGVGRRRARRRRRPPRATRRPRTQSKGAKGEKAAKGKGKKEAKEGEPDGDGPSVAAHPRAARAVARAKSWGGLAGFVLGGYLSLPTNTLAGAGVRALVAGSSATSLYGPVRCSCGGGWWCSRSRAANSSWSRPSKPPVPGASYRRPPSAPARGRRS